MHFAITTQLYPRPPSEQSLAHPKLERVCPFTAIMNRLGAGEVFYLSFCLKRQSLHIPVSTNGNTNPKTIPTMPMPPPPPIPATSGPKGAQLDQPNIKTERDPKDKTVNSVPPLIAIKSEAKEEEQETEEDPYDAIKKSMAANLGNSTVPPSADIITAGERALEQLGIIIHRARVGVYEGTRLFWWEQQPGIWGMKTSNLDRKSREYLSIECQNHLKEADKRFVMARNMESTAQESLKKAYAKAFEAIMSPSYTYEEHKERYRETMERYRVETLARMGREKKARQEEKKQQDGIMSAVI